MKIIRILDFILGRKCINCKKRTHKFVEAEPSRHLTSPRYAGFKLIFCNQECNKQYNRNALPFWANLDRNASDSECFEHDHWETDNLNRKIRVGKCKITELGVKVEPQQPGENSGQPKECYKHFKMRV